MLNLDLRSAMLACNATSLYSGDDLESLLKQPICGFETDSRKIKPGYVFVCAPGEKVDGHDFIPQAFESGAIAVICQRRPMEPIPDRIYILVEDSYEALRQIAKYYRTNIILSTKVVAITGSVGKTSTKEMIASVISKQYRVYKTAGNRNSVIGLPMEILSITPDVEVAVLELGISEFGEMEKLSAIACPDFAVITNIGHCHLENLRDRDGVLEAKSAIFSSMRSDGKAVLYGNDDKLSKITDVFGEKPYRFGNSDCCVWATDIKSKQLEGTSATINIALDGYEDKFVVDIPLPGSHMVTNAMAATVVGHLLGIESNTIKTGIESVMPLPHRGSIQKTDKYVIIDDCYNANVSSMKAAIDMLLLAKGRKVAILGDMFELGDASDRLHGEVGKYAASKHVELLIFIGQNAIHMKKKAMEELVCEGQDVRYFATKEELLDKVDSLLLEGDTVLIKASRGMAFEKIVEKLCE